MSITLFQAPAACSLYRTSKIILQTKDGKICAYCYEVCKKNEQPQVTATFQDSADKCSCTHEGNHFLTPFCLFFSFQIL